jgi:hypothetical protein
MVSLLLAKEDLTLRLRHPNITNPVKGRNNGSTPVTLPWKGAEATVASKKLDAYEPFQDSFEFLHRVQRVSVDFSHYRSLGMVHSPNNILG